MARSGMIKKIMISILFVTTAITAFAGQEGVGVENSKKDRGLLKENTIVPPLLTEKYEYHEVFGNCEKDVQCEMLQKAIRWKDGKKYDSVTSWKVKWDYAYNRDSQACFADSFKVSIEITFRLPKWVCKGKAPQSLVDKWDSYIKNLIAHENGHRDIALKAADELGRTIAELPPASTCADLDREVQALSRERIKRLDEDQKIYDADTNHGFTQGAVFP